MSGKSGAARCVWRARVDAARRAGAAMIVCSACDRSGRDSVVFEHTEDSLSAGADSGGMADAGLRTRRRSDGRAGPAVLWLATTNSALRLERSRPVGYSRAIALPIARATSTNRYGCRQLESCARRADSRRRHRLKRSTFHDGTSRRRVTWGALIPACARLARSHYDLAINFEPDIRSNLLLHYRAQPGASDFCRAAAAPCSPTPSRQIRVRTLPTTPKHWSNEPWEARIRRRRERLLN